MSGEIDPIRRCAKPDMCQSLDRDGGAMRECPRLDKNRLLEEYYGKSGLVLPERLCVSALERFSPVAINKDPFKQHFNDSVHNLEMAFVHDDEATRWQYYEKFIEHNQAMLSEPSIDTGGRLSYFIKAQILDMYRPAYEARVEGVKPSPEQMAEVHMSLCDWLEDFNGSILSRLPKNSHDSRSLVGHYRTEVEIAALLTRRKLAEEFPWPALPREEASHMRRKINHDWYTIDKDGYKHPLQFKTSKNGNGYDVPVVVHQKILSSAKREVENISYVWTEGGSWPHSRHTFEQRLVPPMVPRIIDLLLEERDEGNRMSADHRSLLNLASAYVATSIYNYEPQGSSY